MDEKEMGREEMDELLGMTEDEMDSIAVEYESDTWDSSHLGKVSAGRPSLYDAPMRSVTFKEAEPIIVKIDERAASLKMTRSEYIRSLIDKDLASAT